MSPILIPTIGLIITGGVAALACGWKKWPLALFAMFWAGYNFALFVTRTFP